MKSPPIEKTFRLAWGDSPRTVDPRYAIDADSEYLADLVHCSLMKFDPNGIPKNQLASEMKWVDPKTLEVTLNSTFQFSDGKPVTAEDVQASYEFFKKDLKDPTPLKSNFSSLSRIEVLSPYKLRFHLSEPYIEFTYNLSIGILPKSLAIGTKLTDFRKIISCGDFSIDEWTSNFIQLQRRVENPLKDVQTIRIEIVQDENTRLFKLRNSELDLVQNALNRDQLAKIHEYKNLRLLRRPGLKTEYLAFQFQDPILKQKKVRQAIAYAIDRKKIMDHVFHGWAYPADTILLPSDPYFNKKLKPIEYQVEKAKNLLDEAGFPMKGVKKDEPRFTLKLKTTTNPTRLIFAYALADELNKVGIDLQVESLDWGKFKSDVDQGVAQMWSLNWIGFKGPDIYRYVFATSSIPPNGANRGHFSHFKLDQLLEEGKGTINFSQRKKIYDQVQEIIQEELPYVFLWHEEQFVVIHERVKHYEIYSDGRLLSIPDVVFNSDKKSTINLNLKK